MSSSRIKYFSCVSHISFRLISKLITQQDTVANHAAYKQSVFASNALIIVLLVYSYRKPEVTGSSRISSLLTHYRPSPSGVLVPIDMQQHVCRDPDLIRLNPNTYRSAVCLE